MAPTVSCKEPQVIVRKEQVELNPPEGRAHFPSRHHLSLDLESGVLGGVELCFIMMTMTNV